MSSYLDLPTYIYGNMTPEEKNTLLLGNINEPTVIRGLYQPRAIKMNTSQIVGMFGNVSLPVEIYETHDTENTSADMGKSTLPKIFKN